MKFTDMKRSVLLTILLSVFALVSCNKMDYDFYFSQGGGACIKEMDIDGETLKIRSENESVLEARKMDDTEYCVILDWVLVFYHADEHYLAISVDENNTGRERWFTVSGTKNGKEVSFNFRQRK